MLQGPLSGQSPDMDVIRITEPVLIFGGPYSNLEATRALIDEADRLGFTPERMICTGDVVAYGADASRTVALVRDAVRHVIRGNCEESLANDSEDCGCGFPEGSDCSRLSDAWFQHARRQLNAADRLWMAGLPERLVLDLDGVRLAVVHGSSKQDQPICIRFHGSCTEAEGDRGRRSRWRNRRSLRSAVHTVDFGISLA